MAWGWILLVVLLVVLIAALPVYPYSRSWGLMPGGTLALVVLIVVFLLVLGMI